MTSWKPDPIFTHGFLVGDLNIYAEGDNLVFAHTNGSDRISIANWFNSLAADMHRLDTLSFADGKSLDLHTLQLGGSAADTLTGTDVNDLLVGGAADDVLDGGVGGFAESAVPTKNLTTRLVARIWRAQPSLRRSFLTIACIADDGCQQKVI